MWGVIKTVNNTNLSTASTYNAKGNFKGSPSNLKGENVKYKFNVLF